MQAKLVELIPEFNLIADADLRQKTINVYLLALKKSGWKPEDMTWLPFTLLIKPCPSTMLQHFRGVVKVALKIYEGLADNYPNEPKMKCNPDELVAAALLHDVGKLLEYCKNDAGDTVVSPNGKMLRHPISGTELCYACGIPDSVRHAVACHSNEGTGFRKTLIAHIVHHADFCNFEPLH